MALLPTFVRKENAPPAPLRQITKAMWDSLPKDCKRKHKDGTYHIVHKSRNGSYLEPVFWQR